MAINDQVTIPSGTGSASHWLSGSDVPDDTGATPTGTAPAGSLYFRHDPAAGAPGVGPAVFEKAPAYTPAGAAQAIPAGWRPLAGGEVINVKRFGARGDGTVDDSPAFNAAFAAARAASSYPFGSPPVYAPAGKYLLSSPLNMTSSQLNLVGDGMFQTVLVGNTGTGKCVVDMTGASYSSVADLSILTVASGSVPAPGSPSTFGVVWNRTPGGAMEMNRLERVHVWMGTAASGAPQTIALYNCGSEVSSIRRCSLRADSALVLTLENYAGFVSDYVPTATDGISMTVFEADRDSYLVGLAKACVVIRGAASVRIDSYLTNQNPTLTPPAAVPPYAVEVIGDTYDLYLGGSVEAYPVSLAVLNARLRGLQYHHYHSHPTSGTWTSNIRLEQAYLTESLVHPVPAAGNESNGYPGGSDFLIDGVASELTSSVIYAYGTQNIRLVGGTRNSIIAGCVVVTDGKVGDFTISGVATANGVQIVGEDGVRIGTVGTVSARPPANTVAVGTQHFDVLTARPVWSDGTSWRYADGTPA
ncbi:MAG TPA: glycosyl hydrolase family 28-related protein [Longimicrobium sp.]|jgi:hypothetical protein